MSLGADADRSRSRSTLSTASGARLGNSYQVSLGGSWEPDLWGRLRGGVQNAAAQAEASAADLALATLSAQGELAAN